MNYTIAQLKKMETERISRIFEKLFGYAMFNPFEERDFMIALIAGKLNPVTEKHDHKNVTEHLKSLMKVEKARLNETMIFMIRKALRNGMKRREIADLYNVPLHYVANIDRNRIFKNVV